MERSNIVRLLLPLVPVLLCSPRPVVAQSLPEQVAALSALVRSVTPQADDRQRDSLNDRITAGVRALLGSPGAMQADLSGLPISRVDAPDGRFRLLTWNTAYTDGTFAYHGQLLVQEPERTVLFELADRSVTLGDVARKKLPPDQWYGALYYAVVRKAEGKRTYYTLLGWKGVSAVETRKVIDVLSFSGAVPVFGAALFDEGRQRQLRKVFAYNAQGTMSLKWEESNNAIVLDHLSPLRPELAGRPEFTSPDLSFDAYVWHKGAWRYLRDVDARNMDIVPQRNKPVQKGLRP